MSFTKHVGKILWFLCLALVISVLSLGVLGAAEDDDLLGKYETGDKEFERYEIGDAIVYYHQRMIDEAIVEFDYIRYRFDKNTKELIEKGIHWRDDLPEHLPPIISREEAESMVEGEIHSSSLYFIDPESHVFPITPTPKNPCWAVRILDERGYIKDVIVIDAVEGRIVGHGIPPPSEGFSLSGPVDVENCTGAWYDWYTNAENWFEEMGYSTERVKYPSEAKVKSHVQSHETAMFYEVAHGNSYHFQNSCTDKTTASEVNSWIEDYAKMPFTFLGSCDGMCNTGSGTLSYRFRKGSTEDTCTVGYCGMGGGDCEQYCWPKAVQWQDELFKRMKQGDTVKEAFDWANGTYPQCESCMRFAGDEDFAIMPIVQRQGVKGKTGEVRCDTLSGVTMWLWHQGWPDWVEVATSNGDGYYGFCVDGTGDYWVAATKSGFRDETQEIDITDLQEVYTLDFLAETGLVPNATNVFYVLECVNHWLFPEPPCGLTVFKVLEVVNAWLYPITGEGAKAGGIPLSLDINVVRDIPSQVVRGETFEVTVTFTAPEDEFNAIGLTDFAPDGWDVTVDRSWGTPNAGAVKATNNKAEIAWYGPYDKDTAFTAVYKVTVPGDAPLGVYTFGDGLLEYYVAGTGPDRASVAGEFEIEVVS